MRLSVGFSLWLDCNVVNEEEPNSDTSAAARMKEDLIELIPAPLPETPHHCESGATVVSIFIDSDFRCELFKNRINMRRTSACRMSTWGTHDERVRRYKSPATAVVGRSTFLSGPGSNLPLR